MQEASLPVGGEKSSCRQPGFVIAQFYIGQYADRVLNLSAREGGESCPFAGGERRLLVGYEETRRRGEELEISGGGGEVGW